MTEITPKELMETIVSVADSKKARDIVVMQVTGQTTLTDYFVIMTGTSNTHIRALGDEIELQVKERLQVLPHHREGVTSNWVLVDYNSVVVNIFQKEAREMYALERLWSDGTRIDISNLTVKEEEKQ
ncbi:MAG: ribosome silencing factor [Clostridia bacterium]|nr:ribosome silencing factor [Clostridia bacterium]